MRPPAYAPSADERADARATLGALLADLAALPERARGALVMRELGGLSHEEIAAALGMSAGAAKQAIFEARTALAEIAEGRPWSEVDGVTYRDAAGRVAHTPDRAILEDMDRLPFVTDVYKRDLRVEDYFIGYLKHPYVSLYTGRGCRSKCTFCLWPQTVGGHRYRTRSTGHVLDEMALIPRYFPQVQEVFFDDDTFTDDGKRAEEIARGLGKLGLTWSCNAKANVPYDTLKVMKDNGLRLLLVGYESGNQDILNNIKKGIRLDIARRFTRDCRALGITIHGTFIVGLPGETRETIQETIRFAREINPRTIQVSIAAPYPGTYLYNQAKERGWLPEDDAGTQLVDERGIGFALQHLGQIDRLDGDKATPFVKKTEKVYGLCVGPDDRIELLHFSRLETDEQTARGLGIGQDV